MRDILAALLAAPYALIHLETHEEERALEIVGELARRAKRPLWIWTPARGWGAEAGPCDLESAIAAAVGAKEPGVFALCEVVPSLRDPRARRALREAESALAAEGKSIVLIDARPIAEAELAREVTPIELGLPDLALLRAEADRAMPDRPEPERAQAARAALGLSRKQARRALARVAGEPSGRAADAILAEKRRVLARSAPVELIERAVGPGDVGGLDALKRWLEERRGAFSERARAFGLPTPRGLLLVGVQGCGKSLSAKAIARAWDLALMRLDLGRVFDGADSPEAALREALRVAEALSPCVLWIDEIEKGFADPSGQSARVLGGMLTWLQEKRAPVFLVATANDVSALPPELLRKGRFDEVFFVDLPEEHARRAILALHLAKRGIALPEAAIAKLASASEHFSGAELEQLVVDALYAAFAEDRAPRASDFERAGRGLVPLYKTYEESIKALREWAAHRARPAASPRRVLDFFAPDKA